VDLLERRGSGRGKNEVSRVLLLVWRFLLDELSRFKSRLRLFGKPMFAHAGDVEPVDPAIPTNAATSQKVLANSEPSTHDPSLTCGPR
jgi:hypothetical protein